MGYRKGDTKARGVVRAKKQVKAAGKRIVRRIGWAALHMAGEDPRAKIRTLEDKLAAQERKSADALGQLAYTRKWLAAYITLEAARQVGDEEACGKLESVIADMASRCLTADYEEDCDFDQAIKSCETPAIRSYLKRLYVKQLLPELYDTHSAHPVQDKVVFLNPRFGLNTSFKLIYRRIEKEGAYKPVLHDAHRVDQCAAEQWLNVSDCVKDMATAKGVFCHTFHDYFGYLNIRPETKVIQLWHGCGIIKKLGQSRWSPSKRKADRLREYPQHNNFDLVTMPGEGSRWIFAEMMGIDEDSPILQPIGISRTDEFFAPDYLEGCKAGLNQCLPQAVGKKILLYAPTYRGNDSRRTAPSELDVHMLKQALGDEWLLVIRHHATIAQQDIPPVPEDCRDFAFDFSKDRTLTTNQWMGVADAMISDYSSVVYEYSLFERPIILFLYDYEDYLANRGVYYTIDDLSEWGEICTTNEQIAAYLANVEASFDRKKVRAFREKHMGGCDGHATDRILAFMEGRLYDVQGQGGPAHSA